MITATEPRGNHLLAALPAAEWERWLPQLERVEMPLGQVLYESGTTLSHVYFPLTAIVSLLYVIDSRALTTCLGTRSATGCFSKWPRA